MGETSLRAGALGSQDLRGCGGVLPGQRPSAGFRPHRPRLVPRLGHFPCRGSRRSRASSLDREGKNGMPLPVPTVSSPNEAAGPRAARRLGWADSVARFLLETGYWRLKNPPSAPSISLAPLPPEVEVRTGPPLLDVRSPAT